MSTEYSNEQNIQQEVQAIVERFPKLKQRLVDVSYGVCFSIKTDKEGNLVPAKDDPIKIKKVPADMGLFFKQAHDVLLIIDYGFWETASDREKAGYVHRMLSRVEVSYNNNNEKKIKFRKWDIQENLDTLMEVGEYTQAHREWGQLLNLILQGTQAVISSIQDGKTAKAESEQEVTEDAQTAGSPDTGLRENPLENSAVEESENEEAEASSEVPKPAKRRGRPPKKEKPTQVESQYENTETDDYPGIRINSSNDDIGDDDITPLDVGGPADVTPLEMDDSEPLEPEEPVYPKKLQRPSHVRVVSK